MRCIASYPSIVRMAPSADRNHKLDAMRFLMKSMVLFDDVVEVRYRPTTTAAPSSPDSFNTSMRRGVSRVPIHIDRAWPAAASGGQCQPQELLRGRQIAARREHELD